MTLPILPKQDFQKNCQNATPNPILTGNHKGNLSRLRSSQFSRTANSVLGALHGTLQSEIKLPKFCSTTYI